MNLCCLKCTSILDRVRIDDIDVDLCPECSGLWLDHGEIEKLAKKRAGDVEKLRKLLAGAGGPPPVPSELTSSCPACTSSMKEVMLGPIKVDYCSACKGIFLDKGELDGALQAIKAEGATVSSLIAAAASAAE